MAQKDKTYLRFEGGSSSNYGQTQGGVITNATGTFVFTIFVRLLEWPVATAPICQQATDGGPGSETITWGLWYYADEFAKTSANGRLVTDDSACLGVQFSTTAGPSVSVAIPLTGSGVPGKLGNIYQIQFVQKYNSGDSKTYTAVFVDGVSRYQTNGTGQLEEGPQGDVLRIGHPAILPFDHSGDGQVEEPTCMDIIQFMYENDRTVTITSGEIDAPDSAMDPWERLVVDGGATGQAFTLEEGTGSPSGTQWINPDWADETKVDPQIDEDAGTMAWTFENIFGYSEDEEDAYPQPIFAPIGSRSDPTAGELRLRLLPKIWAEHGALRQGASFPEVYQEWNNPDWGLSSSSAQVAIGDESVLASISTAGNTYADLDDHGGATTSGFGKWTRVWYYDKGGTSSDLIHRIQYTGGTLLWFGVLFSQSLTHYSSSVGGSIAVSSIARSTGWHEFLVYTELGGIEANEKCRIYLDGTLMRSVDASSASANSYIPGTRIRNATSADEFHLDWWGFNYRRTGTPTDFQGLVAPTATVVLPDAQPAGNVVSFDSVTIVDEDAGSSSMEVGTLTYEFAHSTNGGSSFGSYQTLNDTNLQGLTPAGGGQDVIRVRVTLDSGLDDMASPAVRSVTINYTSGIIPRIMHHRQQMAGSC